ncbi:flagellin [Terasakiella sp.]|uniref:flagellin n=1 Tax=Terasakiella sp. TaxID=2034861 RepID=UPI003AA7B97B
MVEQVSFLSTAFSRNVRNTQNIAEVSRERSNRLSTGLRVSQPNDDPADYFRAKALIDRVSDLGNAKGALQLEQGGYQTSVLGLDTVEKFGKQLEGIALAAKSAESAQERQALSDQFNEVRNQINNLVGDATFLGKNLIASNTVSDLNIGDANADYNGFATLSDIDTAIASVNSAVSQVRSTQSDYAVDIAISNVRENFTDDLSNILQDGVDKLVNADLNEDAATLLAAQVRSDLSFQGQKILAQGESLLLGLF